MFISIQYTRSPSKGVIAKFFISDFYYLYSPLPVRALLRDLLFLTHGQTLPEASLLKYPHQMDNDGLLLLGGAVAP